MKRKVWVASPVFYLLVAVMLVTAAFSWFYNSFVFYVEMILCALGILAITLAVSSFRAHVRTAVSAAQKVLTGAEYRSLQDFSMPTAVVGDSGDIVWVNDAFSQGIGGGQGMYGENICKLLAPKTLEEVYEGGGSNVSIGEKKFTVFAVATEGGGILYFVDDTYYKEVERRYNESRPIVALVTFDNREELARNTSANEDARIASEVENVLRDWSQTMGGFLKRMSGSRFLIMTDELHVREAAEKRFEILDKVREIKTGEHGSATVSIGVGRGAPSLAVSELWARQALDMALGRGGDQVAIKQKDDQYEFFGGLSKGVEKRDKVRTRVIAATLSDHIKASEQVLIMGHKFSDLDCVGSAVGMWSAVSKGLKKPAYIVINRRQSLASALVDSIAQANEEPVFLDPEEALPLAGEKTLLIVVDTHSQDFVESNELLELSPRVVVIDHHRMMVKRIGNALVFYHEPYASSASEMVTELVQYFGENTLSRLEAEALLSGIMLDTKNFVLKTGVRTFEAAAYLRRRGADTVEVKRLFSNSIDTYKAKYQLVSSAEIYNNCAIATADAGVPDVRIAAAQAADELLSIQGVTASFVMFPTGDSINISARSLGDVNVQILMEELGGGGHLTMAGAQLAHVTIQQARAALIKVLNNKLPQASKLPSAGNAAPK